MKKQNLALMAFLALASGGLQAAEHEVAVAKTEVAAATLSPEEQAFAGKLSDRARKIFAQMSAEERKAAMAVATDPALNADGAVDKVMHKTETKK